jgi:PhnB protein
MAQQLNPYITFNGNCAEAIGFYASVLGGEPQLMTFRESGTDVDGIMHAALDTPAGFHIFASDAVAGMGEPFQPGNNLQISLSGDEADALRGYWTGLGEGGQVVVPLERQMWGDDYGLLVDKYGVQWHVNIAGAAAG